MSDSTLSIGGRSVREGINRVEMVKLIMLAVCTALLSTSLAQARPLKFAVMDLAPYGYIT
jgi:hypothetical protein